MIGETTRKVKIFIVDSRDNQRLGKLVAQHINPGCIVHTDGWRAYDAIDWPGLGIRRHRHVHLNNQNRRNFEHSNLIEGLWSVIKGNTRRQYNAVTGSLRLEDYLLEAKMRRDFREHIHRRDLLDAYSNLLVEAYRQ